MKFFLSLFSLLLMACSSQSPKQNTSLGDKNYNLHIPDVPYIKRIDDGDVAATALPNEILDINDWRVEIYERSSCPPFGISEQKEMPIGGNRGIWGKVDFWDEPDAMNGWLLSDTWKPGDIPPFCRPPFPHDFEFQKYVSCEPGDDPWSCASKQRQYELGHGMYSAYAFCAEKDGKAVAICIQQMTDDEAMAKEIFESFRWTD